MFKKKYRKNRTLDFQAGLWTPDYKAGLWTPHSKTVSETPNLKSGMWNWKDKALLKFDETDSLDEIYSLFFIYIYIYERETNVCMCYTITVKQKTQRLFDEFSYSFNT